MHEDLAARTASIRGGRGAGRRVRLAGRAGGGLDAGTAAGLRAGTSAGRRTDASRAAPDGSARREAGAEAAKGAVRASATRRRASVVLLALAAACGALAAGCAGSPPAAPAGEADRIPAPVLTPPPVPKPEPGEPVEVYSVSVEDVPAGELLFALARDAGLDIDVDPGIEGRITMNAVDEPLPDLLRRISRHAALRVEIEDGVLAARRDEPVLRAYPIDYVSVARDVETVNEVGTGLGGAIGSPAGEENGSSADVRGKAEHRFWDALVESVRAVLGESPDGASGVFAHRETSLIAVRASAARHREVAAFLDGVLASARRQVLIEAVIVEVGLDDRFRSGVNFSRLFGGDLRVQTGLPGGNFGDSAPFALLSSADLGLTVRLLREFGEVQVLSTPIVMALNNQTAIVKIAENRAFFTSEVRTTSNDTTIERNVQTKLHTVPVGLILLVTPSVAADGEIVLKVRPTVTRQTGFVVDPNPTLAAAEVVSRIPEIAVREIESVLRLRSGEVAVLGGLMQEESREDTAGVPLLSRLPGIGAAFRYRDRRTEKTELIVFLRPTVVRDPSLDADLGRFHRWWRRTGEPAGREAVRGPGPGLDPDSRPDRRTVPAAGAAGAAAPATGTGKQQGIRIEQAWGGNPADGMLGRAWTALQRGALRGARGVVPGSAGRAAGGGPGRPRRARGARGEDRGGAGVVPPPARARAGARDRAGDGRRARCRREPGGARTGDPGPALGPAGSSLASRRARPLARRAGPVGGRRRRLSDRPSPRPVQSRSGVQPGGERGPARSPGRRARPLPRGAGARRPLAPRLRRARGARTDRGARRAGGDPAVRRRTAPPGPAPLAGGAAAGPDPLANLLVETGAISEDQARIARTEQRNTGAGFTDVLAKLGFVTEGIVRDALGGALGVESVDLGSAVAEADATAAVPERVARRFLAAGLAIERDAAGAPRRLTVAMADPFDVIALDHLRSLFDGDVEITSLLAGRSDVERFIERAYGHDLSVAGILAEIESGGEPADPAGGAAAARAGEYGQPIVRLVDVLLSDAVKQGASDVHFEPERGFLRVRYRIDGVLRQVRSLHRGYWSAIAVRLKVMCGMNIAETRAPQDGRMTLSVSGRDIDYRVSSLPTTHGENIVLRVLDRSRGLVPLDELGMSPGALAELGRMMERPEGLILVTGPTGSGKTTTLYSMLAHLDREAVNVMTWRTRSSTRWRGSARPRSTRR